MAAVQIKLPYLSPSRHMLRLVELFLEENGVTAYVVSVNRDFVLSSLEMMIEEKDLFQLRLKYGEDLAQAIDDSRNRLGGLAYRDVISRLEPDMMDFSPCDESAESDDV